MIKRIGFALVLAIVPALAFAQSADRDVLLTPEGTLYTIESIFATDGDPTVQSASSKYLLLTVQQGNQARTMVVPGSLRAGLHSSPTLAYDSDSNTLFMFWEQALNTTLNGTSLQFCSYQNGKWRDTTELDAAKWRLRHNLRIGVTHKTEDGDTEGHPLINELTVHAIWWEESGYGEWARYAMLTIDKGNVTHTQIRDMSDFTDPKMQVISDLAPGGFSTEVLRHPQVFESSSHSTIDIVFGDITAGGFHRITLKPVVHLRVRIPIGVRDQTFPSPRSQGDSLGTGASQVSALSGEGNRLVFFSSTAGQVKYAIFKGQEWSPVRSINLSGNVTRDVAVNAIRRMLTSE